MKLPYVVFKNGVSLSVCVQSDSSHAQILILDSNRLAIKVPSARQEGKANAMLCQILAKYFDIPKSYVTITRGKLAKQKTVFLHGNPQTLLQKLKVLFSEDQGT